METGLAVAIIAIVYVMIVGYLKRGTLSVLILSAYARLINWKN